MRPEIDFLNMSMTTGPGRSYKYYQGTPLYPFGFGLSYTSFKLEWSPNPPDHETRFTSAVSSTTYKCKVTNTGSVTGDEVVLAFHKPQGSSIATLPDGTPVPSKVLFGSQGCDQALLE